MPSIVTDNFRVFAAEQFIESLEEPYTNSSGDTVADGDAGGLSEAYRSKVYLFTGRSQEWSLEKYDSDASISEINPPVETDSFNAMNEIYDDMISLKRVNRSDVSKVIRKITWKSGVKYDMYKNDYGPEPGKGSINGQTKLYDSQFYVMNSNYQVFKCIYNGEKLNNSGVVSTVEPTVNSTSIGNPLSDGYRWKYMYTINIDEYIKFVSSDFIPIKNESAVVAAAVDGSIDQLILKNAGSGISNGDYFCPIDGDGTTPAVAKIVVTGNVISEVSMKQVGAGYTRGTVRLDEPYNSEAKAITRLPADQLTALSGQVEAIISPPGGHGSDASLELGGYRVMINKSLDFLDGSGDIPVDSQFRRYGLLSDPKKYDGTGDLISATATGCHSIKFAPTTTAVFTPGKIISQVDSVGNVLAKGRVIHYDNVNKILRYYQNEFIDATQTGANQYKLIPFSGNNAIVEADTGTTITPDTTFTNSTLYGVIFNGGYANPEVKKNSGRIIYIENRQAVNRSSDQIEDIKLVIEF